MKPVFIMFSERSGSNLLRSMLGAHPDVSAPPPQHLWMHLSNALPYYGSLEEDEALERLVEDAVALTQVEGHHLEWQHEVPASEIVDEVEDRTLSGVLSTLYEAYARREGASAWVCKENDIYDHAHQIREVRPDAQVVYLVRDGRDVTCSTKKIPSNDQHTYAIARTWRQEQEACMEVHQELRPLGASHLVRYEDLLDDPKGELQDLCEAVGLPFDEAMLRFHERDKTQEESERTDYWENLDQPVMKGNKGKFLDQLSPRQIRIFEAEAGEVLELLGYPLENEDPGTIPLPVKAFYLAVNWVQCKAQTAERLTDPPVQKRAERLSAIHDTSEDPGPSFESEARY